MTFDYSDDAALAFFVRVVVLLINLPLSVSIIPRYAAWIYRHRGAIILFILNKISESVTSELIQNKI